MAAKRSQGKLLTLAVQTECMIKMVIEQVLPFLVFLLEKKFDEFGKIGCPERQRRGFVITNATRVCNVHFQQSDIVRSQPSNILYESAESGSVKSYARLLLAP